MIRGSGNFKLRARFLCLLFFILSGLLVGRLFFIQVAGHDFYAARAERQFVSFKSKPSISIRGDIYFKEKSDNLISAATIKDGFLVAVMPNIVKNAEALCQEASEILDLPVDSCFDKTSKKNDPFEILGHRLSDLEVEKIKNIEEQGIGIFPEQWRFYPGNSLASQVLGFVGYKGDELVGRYGVEQYYEDVLKGRKESLEKGDSFAALFWELGRDFLGTEVASGHDIILTIEPRVQLFLEDILGELMKDWGSLSAGGVVMDPRSGAVLAMASRPAFNPNNYNEVEDIFYFRNPLVSSIFELGSVFKPLTLAAAIDQGEISPQTTYVDRGFVAIDGRRIENYDGKARGKVDMQTVLSESLNTGAVFAMQQLGKTEFLKYIRAYGFDKKTGVDLPDEIEGQLSNLLTLRDIEYATASFGHGIAVSPIEFCVAMSSIANGGLIVEPYIVDKIIVKGGKDYTAELTTEGENRVLKETTAKTMTKMLVEVVDEALLGGTVKVDHYSIAAKTGTALLPKKGELGYYEDQYLHSFFGYAPAFDARFLVFLYLEKPQGVKYASHTLTQPFMKLMKFLLNYYEVPPDR